MRLSHTCSQFAHGQSWWQERPASYEPLLSPLTLACTKLERRQRQGKKNLIKGLTTTSSPHNHTAAANGDYKCFLARKNTHLIMLMYTHDTLPVELEQLTLN